MALIQARQKVWLRFKQFDGFTLTGHCFRGGDVREGRYRGRREVRLALGNDQ